MKCQGHVRPEADRFCKILDGIVEVAFSPISDSPVVICPGIVGIEANRLCAVSKSLIVSALVLVGPGPSDVALGNFWGKALWHRLGRQSP